MKALLTILCTTLLLFGTAHAKSYERQLSSAFVKVAKDATPAVVYIKAEVVPQYDDYDEDPYNDEFFNRFFGTPKKPQAPSQGPQMSHGTGFIVSKEGHIVTNYHVVRDARRLTVLRSDGEKKEYAATLVGGDPQTDVAILKLDDPQDNNLPFLTFGDSNDMEVGEWVMAIGSPFQLEATVTVGIISAKGRQNLQITDLEDFIQTDAAINPGNSGGPLLNLDGEVIAINTAIVSPSGGYIGIGFCVPSKIAASIMNQVITTGKISRGFLGVMVQPIDKDLAEAFDLQKPEGVLITEVVADSPAERAGLKAGDVITRYNGKKVFTQEQLRNNLMLLEPGTKVKLEIMRKGKPMNVTVKLGDHSSRFKDNAVQTNQLGLTVENLTPNNIAKYHFSNDDIGVVVTKVDPNSLAARAGIKSGALIMAVNHEKITSISDFHEALTSVGDSKRVLLLAKQSGRVRFFTLKP
ncbi:MAG: Periplasmic pH-dependent serine endoprotease DegQ [Chlamydiia bacterium]|nr:Periplasmic pH-dependent serine endoprotease DegQ [Chlamydiia bacterium]MCH9615218.1 Periplasmic pH-dependent serine endoprotease DegQ [Chlamydiia bacterium]MCH9628460.1 Periplasmic pH-dependent serine endoprotease DegQ [Chlamydiia bacterium]